MERESSSEFRFQVLAFAAFSFDARIVLDKLSKYLIDYRKVRVLSSFHTFSHLLSPFQKDIYTRMMDAHKMNLISALDALVEEAERNGRWQK